ncbi:hypothetical protein U1Q18_036032 [Sarracenia purpurea var. burkii]
MALNTAGAFKPPPALSDVLFSEWLGASAGDFSGDSVGGAGGESTADGAFADTGAGLRETTGDGDGDVSSGAGAGDGELPKSSIGRSTLSTVKIQSGVESITVLAIREESRPVLRVT